MMNTAKPPIKHKVRRFYYDGFGTTVQKGFAAYTATLIRWTLDPGVGLFQCSDGKERLIPCCCLHPYVEWVQPAVTPTGYSPVLYIGAPSKS